MGLEKVNRKYYRFGTENNFRFIVGQGVKIELIEKFYSPSRLWARLFLKIRGYKLFHVKEQYLHSYLIDKYDTDLIIKGNDPLNQKYISIDLKSGIIRKWSKTKGGIKKINKEYQTIKNLKPFKPPLEFSHIHNYINSTNISVLEFKISVRGFRIELDDFFIKKYYEQFIEREIDDKIYVHGDLTVWNVIKKDEGDYTIIDWENYHFNWKYYDLFHYYFTWFKLSAGYSKEKAITESKKKCLQLSSNIDKDLLLQTINNYM